MTRTEELLGLAEAAISNPVAYSMRDGHTHVDMGRAIKQELFKQAANPETIKQLVELVQLQHEALKEYTGVCRSHNDPNDFTPRVIDEGFHARNAIAAFERFEQGGE